MIILIRMELGNILDVLIFKNRDELHARLHEMQDRGGIDIGDTCIALFLKGDENMFVDGYSYVDWENIDDV